jgi:hypothetical protein
MVRARPRPKRTPPDTNEHYRTVPHTNGHYRTLPNTTGHKIRPSIDFQRPNIPSWLRGKMTKPHRLYAAAGGFDLHMLRRA